MDIVTIWAGAATLSCGGLTYLWLSARIDRDEARADLKIEQQTSKALENRCTVLRGDNIAQQHTIDTLRAGHDALVDERDQAIREIGRIRAEKVALKPKRGPNGRFISKSAAKSTPKPVACG